MFVKITFILCFCLNVSILSADEVLQKESNIDKILDLSGIHKQTLQLKDILAGSLREGIQKNKSLSPEQVEKLFKISLEEFKPENTLKNLKNKLSKEWSEKELDELANYYNQDDVKKFSRLEEEGTTRAAQKAFVEYAKGLANNPPHKEKVLIVQNFVKEAKIVDLSVNVVIDVQEGMAIAFNQNCTGEIKNKIRNEITPTMNQNVTLFFLFIYKDIPLKDLKQYFNTHLTNKLLLKLTKDQVEEQRNGFRQWGIDLGKRIKIEFKPKKV